MHDKVKKKIRKLLALARKAGTEAEAANAMEKVHMLLLKHNLELSDVDVREYDMIVEDIQPGHEWEMPMWVGVSTLYLGKYLINQQPLKHILIGQSDNIQVIRETLRQLVIICNELVKTYAPLAQETTVPMQNHFGQYYAVRVPNLNVAASLDSFRRGFAARVHNRCMAEAERAKHMGAQSAPDAATGDQGGIIGTALVVRELYEQEAERIASFLAEAGLGYEQAAMDIEAADHHAFMNGFEAAGDVSLSKKAELQ